MVKLNRIKLLAAAFVFVAASIGQASALDNASPQQAVSEYLSSLLNGDTQTLSAMIDGRMKRKSRALALSPESYSTFLKNHYAGVETTVEEITPNGEKMLARVRFDYPTSDTSHFEFIMEEIDGRWKITDENY